ncbi:hypothetical protein CO026_01910 [Candidatus Kaiserbacteria bacterium CG_4_9_14_0_2_um_filter_41_32]|uniref:DUF4870 domain-containing protein n=1 Tax=Candidatus Kaiserbacteria bacterium CG_4_9_14_0_2_um_filter_41_32 TaxID=1974601 RepID=A0A2M8FES9_9BACT|nr:MAG: hypothetical protein CO026_01910 [Candidatus Kaiserbacteria bacterium CG_4_9_14_0_2_um_filter_41_32]
MDQNNNENTVHGEATPVVTKTPEQSSATNEPVVSNTTAKETVRDDNVKLYAILGYVLPFLFFLPLINERTKHNEYSRFHANQQLILLLVWVAVQIVAENFLHIIIGYGSNSLLGLFNIAVLILAVLGIINAVQHNMKELPLVGGFRILK